MLQVGFIGVCALTKSGQLSKYGSSRPPIPCFVHRVDAKPPVFIDGTTVPSFLYTVV
jgi:hypothetical protein